MTEAELYKELGALTKDKGRWKESISYVSSLLTHDSVKKQAKALWLLSEMVGTSAPYISRLINKKDGIVNKVFVEMLEKLGYDIQITYVKKETD